MLILSTQLVLLVVFWHCMFLVLLRVIGMVWLILSSDHFWYGALNETSQPFEFLTKQ